ncbi:hypothetical protein T265_15903, partial [Opisthorchis viverrini]
WNADSTRCPVQRSEHPTLHLNVRQPLCPTYGMKYLIQASHQACPMGHRLPWVFMRSKQLQS